MNIPLSVYSDGSLELGNDTPSVLAKSAKKNGYSRIALIDNDSTSHLVSFLKATKEQSLSPIVGVTLTVQCEVYAQFYFLEKNKEIINSFKDKFGVSDVPSEFTAKNIERSLSIMKVFNSSFSAVTIKKLSNAVDKVADELTEEQLSEFKEINTKGNEKAAFEFALSSALSSCAPKNLISLDDFTWYRSFIARFHLDYTEGKLVVVAKDSSGYRNVLRLTSLKAMKKRDNVKNGNKSSLGLTIDEIESDKEGVLVLDPMTEHSLMGSLNDADAVFDKWSRVIDVLGVGINSKKIDFIKEKGVKAIPFPVAHYADENDYESYCVKVAVHRGDVVGSLFFAPPKKDTFVRTYESAISYYESLDISQFDLNFWEREIKETEVPLGEVHLPNYDMPVKEVIEHGFSFFKKEERKFDSEELAVAEFEKWLESSKPEGKTLSSYKQKKLNDYCMHKLAMDGLDFRLKAEYGDDFLDHKEAYLERIDYEYGVIESMGFSGYFLIEYDFVSQARKMNVPVGPGRGSAAGSLIVYCMEITDVDPIVHGLQFERFLNPERVSMPDIDVDFGRGRNDVLGYIRDKHQTPGTIYPSSSQIANIMRYQLKSSLSCVRNAYGLSMVFDGELKKLVAEAEAKLGIVAPKSISWSEFLSLDFVTKRMKKEPMLRKVVNKAKDLTGKMSSFGVHAGGVVISPTTVTDYSSVSCDDDGNFFSQLDKDDIESVGLIKFDVLGARTLSIIDECVSNIQKSKGISVDVRKIDIHDPAVYELICQQNLCDIFQLESPGMNKLVGNLRPQNMEELAVLSALFRPGALQSGMVEEYIDVKNGVKPPAYDHPAMEKTTKETFGCIVYQEQVMSTVRELAGYSLGQADLLRRAMGKKKIEEMIKQRSVYTNRAMSFWRDHYKKVGEGLELSFVLDVNVLDLKEELEALGIFEYIDKDGYLSDAESAVSLLTKLLGLSEGEVENLRNRLGNYDYKTHFFKNHYQSEIYSAIKGKVPDDRYEEVKTRVFYILSQYVRFNQVFNKVEKFAGYGFNKSHAIAYSVVTFMCAYLKRYYPTEFYAAALTFRELDKLNDTVSEASQKMGVRVLGPDINKSICNFSYEEEGVVRYGLDKLKGLGNSGPSIVEEREKSGSFVDVYDFLYRLSKYKNQPDVTGFASLSTAGSFDYSIPKRILSTKGYNGRQYILWLRDRIVDGGWLKDGDNNSVHHSFDSMSDFEFNCYVISLLKMNQVKKDLDFKGCLGLIREREEDAENESEDESEDEILENLTKLYHKCLTSKMNEKKLEDAKTAISMNLGGSENKVLSHVCFSDLELTSFNAHFVRVCSVFVGNEDLLNELVSRYLSVTLKKEATETLNEERKLAGFYITSNPLRVLKVAERVEMEPPSSVIDGCPVPLSKIDSNYDRRKTTTYGIVRDIQIKTVKKKDSENYGSKIFSFKIEDGADYLNCVIFGDKKSNLAVKLLKDGCVAMFAGRVKVDNYGVGLEVEVIRRYFPEVDECVNPAFRK